MLVNIFHFQGKKIFYITNNNTKTQQEYFEKCTRLGFSASLVIFYDLFMFVNLCLFIL